MSYRETYYSRIRHMGDSTAEIIRNGGIRSFEKWMAQSPFTIKNLSVERELYFSGIIEENKDKEYKKLMFLHVANDIPIKVGDIMNWQIDDGSIEKWLLLNEEKKVNGTYRTFEIIRCNYLIKWIDESGRLQQSWSYVLSSTDDKVKGNFRTWHNLITPQPNKYAEIIMPRHSVARGTNFIIEDEGWKLVEADFTSVSGIIYMSLTEGKVNYQYDDLDTDIADTDKLHFPLLAPIYTVGDIIDPDFGEFTFNEWEIELIPQIAEGEEPIVELDNGKLRAIAPGDVTIIMQLKDRKAVQKRFEVSIKASEVEFMAYIDGADQIRLDRKAVYSLKSNDIVYAASYKLSSDLAILYVKNGDKVELYDTRRAPEVSEIIVHANNKNKLDDIVLTATYNGQEYSKTIKIIPLW